jgi:hypothetical protein
MAIRRAGGEGNIVLAWFLEQPQSAANLTVRSKPPNRRIGFSIHVRNSMRIITLARLPRQLFFSGPIVSVPFSEEAVIVPFPRSPTMNRVDR